MRAENGFGTVVCLDKTGKKRRKPWAVRLTIGWVDGKQKTKYLGYYTSQKEAKLALAQYHLLDMSLDANTVTFQEVFNAWLEKVSENITEKNRQAYVAAFNLIDQIHGKRLKDLKTDELQRAMNNIKKKHATKAKVKSMLNQIYKYAVNKDYILKNYASDIEIKEKQEKVGSIFTEDEIKLLWNISEHRIAKITLVLIYTGMRIGELLEIQRDKINFEERYIVGGIKTEAGKDRVIPVHKKILPLVYDLLGDYNYIVHNGKGHKVQYSTVKYQFDTFMSKNKLEHKPHDTRKTAVSLFHSANIPLETIQIIVGHSGQSVTEKVYLRKSPAELVTEIDKIEINV